MKKAGGAFLTELLLATVLVLIIAAGFFGIQHIPGFSLEPEAKALIQSVGDNEICNVNLLNLIRSPNEDGTLGDTLITSYLTKDYTVFNETTTNILNQVMLRRWVMNLSINNRVEATFGDPAGFVAVPCIAYVPLPQPFFSNCSFSEIQTGFDGYEINFTTPDGNVTMEIVNQFVTDSDKIGGFGVYPTSEWTTIPETAIIGEPTTINDTLNADLLILQIYVGDESEEVLIPYELTISEPSEDPDGLTEVHLTKKDLVQQCSIALNLFVELNNE